MAITEERRRFYHEGAITTGNDLVLRGLDEEMAVDAIIRGMLAV